MKKLVSFVLAAAVLCAGISAGAVYRDGGVVLSDWAINDYHMANEYCILNWFTRGGDFTEPITRAEFCDMVFNVVRAARNGITAEIDAGRPEPFNDTDRYSVYCLEQLGVAKGTGVGIFDPEGTLTREQAAAFIYRAGEFLDFTYLPSEPEEFTDADEIALWARDAVEVMQAAGLMTGTDTGNFMPGEEITREQAAAVLVRFLEKNGFNYGIYVKDEDGVLTEDDFAGLNGKYRPTGEDSYEVTYYQGNFAKITVNVKDGRVLSAIYTSLDTGKTTDLKQTKMMDIPIDYTRTYLGGSAYVTRGGGKLKFELGGRQVLTLTDDYGNVGYQNMGGEYLFYGTRKGGTDFISANGEILFTVSGIVSGITNRYIITEAYRYPGDTVDGSYTVYGVYTHEGEELEKPGLSDWELYEKGYVTDD